MGAAAPGQFGRFRVPGELGRGAMGVVYRAEDPALGRPVAIKTSTLTGTEEERAHFEARFLQEARAAGGIGHPAIVTIYDVGREGDVAFMAMELLGEARHLLILLGDRQYLAEQGVEEITWHHPLDKGQGYAQGEGRPRRQWKVGRQAEAREQLVQAVDRLTELGLPVRNAPGYHATRILDARETLWRASA